jgi:glutathione S-transferase
MIRLYHAPRTRSLRVLWLLEELGIPYALENVTFDPPAQRFFNQRTPLGKVPTLEDGDVLMCESGAILEYLLERYGNGRLAPPPGTPARAQWLQWIHFAESTAFPPLGILVWLTRYRQDAASYAALVEDTRTRAASGFEFVERALTNRDWLAGDEFSAADVMMGFTLIAAQLLGVLDDRFPRLQAYLTKLEQRPALQRAMAMSEG